MIFLILINIRFSSTLDTVYDHHEKHVDIYFFIQIGTGCFILYNTGQDLAYSRNGLLTTVAYKWNDDDPVYALEVRKWWCLEKIYQI